MKKKVKSLLSGAFKLIFSATLIAWLIQSGKLEFAGLERIFSPKVLIICTIFLALNTLFASERWRLLLKSQNFHISTWGAFKLTLIGLFFNFAMPGGVGGDVVKAWYFYKENSKAKVTAVSSVLMDRLIGLYAMVFLALVALVLDFPYIRSKDFLLNLIIILALLWVGFSVAFIILFSKKMRESKRLTKIFNMIPLGEKFEKLFRSLNTYGDSSKIFWGGFCISLLSQFCAIGFLWVVANTLAEFPIDFQTIAFVAPLGFIATALPISPAGIGVGQAAFYFLFNFYSNTQTSIGSVSITAFQLAQFGISLFGAYLYITRKKSSDFDEIQNFAQ